MKSLLNYFRKKKPLAKLIDNTYRIVPAFTLKGETYFMHEDPMNVVTGRGLTAMQFYDEILMRCSVQYLSHFIEAGEKIFSDPKKIDLPALMRLHFDLKERVKLSGAMKEHVFKMASVIFFTESESPYRYDEAYNKKKIKAWREDKNDMYDFFLQTPLKTLLPFLSVPPSNSLAYMEVQEKINALHLAHLSEVLSREILIEDT